MGAGASSVATQSLIERFPPPSSPEEAKTQCEAILAEVTENIKKDDSSPFSSMEDFVNEAKGVMEEADCDYVSLCDHLKLRSLSCARVKELMANPPSSVDDLVARYPDEVNLAMCQDDDQENEGWLSTFGFEAITRIPSQVFGMTGVVKLYLKKNQLPFLPAEIAALKSLRILDVSENQIEVLPPEIGECTNLEVFNIAENALGATGICKEIGKLTKLKTLIAFKNQIKTLPNEICSCVSLTEVNFFNNKLTKLPKDFNLLIALEDLNLGGNKLKTLCSTEKFANLERLAVSWNNIVLLRNFSNMPKLKILQLNRNQLDALDGECLAASTDLEQVDISANRLTELPSSITKCTNLENLNASTNGLTVLPDLSACSKMSILNVGSNKLTSVDSANIPSLKSIKTLFMNGNDLSDLPAGLSELAALSRINVNGNPKLVANPPAELLKKIQERCTLAGGRYMGPDV